MKNPAKYFWGSLLLAVLLHPITAEVLVDPPALDLSPEDFPDGHFAADIHIENKDDRPLSISFIPDGADWSLDPSELELQPGGTSLVRISGPLPEEEPVTVLFLSDREDVPYLYFIRRELSADAAVAENKADLETDSVFFYTPGCLVCETFYNDLIPELVETYNLSPLPEKRNIYDPGNFELMSRLLSVRQSEGDDFPVLIAGDKVFRGEQQLFQDFPAFLAGGGSLYSENDAASSDTAAPDRLPELSWFPVFLAGLLDGINPCAFTTLIFLISYLKLLGKRGRDILKIGSSFTLGVFITYFLIGLGFFQAVRMAESFFLIAQILRWGMVLLLLILSGMSFFDYVKVRQGKAGESLLQLSDKTKKRIHKTVRNSSRSSLLVLSSFGAGAVISLYELGCTGQVYLPMVVYMVKQDADWFTLFPLVLYNLGFILPLALVFVLFYRGADSSKIARIFEQRLGVVKLMTAILFLVIAVLLVLFG